MEIGWVHVSEIDNIMSNGGQGLKWARFEANIQTENPLTDKQAHVF